ncbi:MAG: beta-N-acetylhexosaminidase [Chthonomonadaceae bacterium]|nr:beta-N-acetylhexosaminidase [Chthonomonadaceae bacterium]
MAMATLSTLNLVPAPVSVVPGLGTFELNAETVILASEAALGEARLFAEQIAPGTGLKLEVDEGEAPRNGAILLRLDPDRRGNTTDESYTLEVSPFQIRIDAASPSGLFYGCQTLRQMMPAATFGTQPSGPVQIPCARIEDAPRFQWRGAMLDCARHFMPKAFVMRFIDLLALHKMNSFHWHLTDDQGWRVEIKRYPKLTEIGAWRDETLVGHYGAKEPKYDGVRHGGYYTQKDIREIVAYAARRHVNVVPEIEMPGHSQAAIAAYPELGNTDTHLKVMTTWGVNPNVLNTEDSTIEFLQNVLAEVIELFPSKFIHVGGDECPKDQWKASERVQAKMKALGIQDEHEMQSWFIRQMDKWLADRGRRLIGWDEILEGGLAPGATVMSWRGIQGGITAAKSGHDVVMAPTSHLYLDYYQARPTDKEPLAIGGFLPLEKVYAFDPVPEGFTDQEAARVLGAQGQIWTEYIATPEYAEYMGFPRICALAEVVWTPQAERSYPDFLERLQGHLARLAAMKVNFRKLD